MAQSKDRVKFKLHSYMFDAGRRAKTMGLLNDAFNMRAPESARLQDVAFAQGYVEIICRPSQFARFLIYREQAGYQNMFKELEASLFVPEAEAARPVDVSGNQARL